MSKDIFKKLSELKRYLKNNNHKNIYAKLQDLEFNILKKANKDLPLEASEDLLNLTMGNMVVSKSENSRSPIIKYIQRLLIKNDYKLPRFGVDGIFGKETEKAVKSFQRRNDLDATGIITATDMSILTTNPKAAEKTEAKDIVEGSESGVISEESPAPIGNWGAAPIATGDGGTIYLGDSQMAGKLGDALAAVGGDGIRIAKSSTTASHWASSKALESALRDGPSKIIISLNGNGISGTSSLIQKIKDIAFASPIANPPVVIWTGAPPPIYKPNGGTWASYLTTKSGWARAYKKRKGFNDTVGAEVEAAGWTFIDPYDYMLLDKPIYYDGETYTSGYSCSQCDGIHLPSNAANEYVSKISGAMSV